MNQKSKKRHDIIKKEMIKQIILLVLGIFLAITTSVGGYFWGQKIYLTNNPKNLQIENNNKKANQIASLKKTTNISVTPMFTPSQNQTNLLPQTPSKNQIRYLANGDYLFNLVTKENALPQSYAPKDLVDLKGLGLASKTVYVRKIILPSLQKMIEDAQKKGIKLEIISGFRSYEYQKYLYQQSIKNKGQAYTEKVIAKPGHSEHQLGTTIDFGCFCSSNMTENFENTPQGKWLLANSYNYGFVLSYPKGKTQITGYIYEPWHFRYIGSQEAILLKQSGLTLVEYLSTKPQYFKK